jgi:hypothetical protein
MEAPEWARAADGSWDGFEELEPPMTSFEALVQQGLDKGMEAPEAEQRARQLLYGSSHVGASASTDEIWASLQRTWAQRPAVSLMNVLDDISALLERGIVSEEGFGELLAKAHATPNLTREAAAASPPLPALEASSARCIQRCVRGWRGRERFAWVVREKARVVREEKRKKRKEAEAEAETKL